MIQRHKLQHLILALSVGVILLATPLLASGFELSEISLWGDSTTFGVAAAVHPMPGGGAAVSDFSRAAVRTYDDSHDVVDTFGTYNMPGATDDLFNFPSGIDLDRAGYLWIADAGNNRVKALQPDGNLWIEVTGLGGPRDVAFDNRNRIYIADSANDKVVVVDSDTGNKLDEWGTTGIDNGDFSFPTGIAVDHDRMVYVADSSNNRIQKFDSDGNWVATWGGVQGSGEEQFDNPYRVGVNPRGDVYVAEVGNERVQVLSSQGQHIKFVGVGTLLDPWDATPGIYRDLYVADSGHDRIAEYSGSAPSSTATEIAGPDRYGTAVALSQSEFADGSCDDVVLATGQNYADALAAAQLAGMHGAPILLTRGSSLPAAVGSEIQRLGADRVFIVGGTGAVSGGVETAVGALPGVGEVERIAGATRYETAFEVVKYVDWWTFEQQFFRGLERRRPIFIATGRNFPDALAVGPLAAAMEAPIFLCNGDAGLTGGFKVPWFRISEIILVGGESVVPESVKDDIAAGYAIDGSIMPKYTRIAGTNRYETAALLAEHFVENYAFDWGHTAFAVGTNYPDALAGGPIQGYENSPLLLARPTALPAETKAAIVDNRLGYYDIRYLGGAGTLSSAVRAEIEAELP